MQLFSGQFVFSSVRYICYLGKEGVGGGGEGMGSAPEEMFVVMYVPVLCLKPI